MRTRLVIRNALATISVAILCLSACSHVQKTNPPISKADLQKQQERQRQQRLSLLQADLKNRQAKVDADQKQIPLLLAQSDASLKQAQELKKQAAQTKDKKQAKILQGKADAAQKDADAKAEQAIALRQELYAQFDTIADLQNQIKVLPGQNQAAQRVAAGNADGNGGARRSAKTTSDKKAAVARRNDRSNM